MTAKEKAKLEIKKLVDRFEDHYSEYKDLKYSETPTRRDFIDPFFKALGWDVDNQGSMAEAYREVIHEDKVKISGQLKSPDYSFRFNGKRYFFVEAKKPSVNIKEDSNPAYQVKRYAWSAKLRISIVTDFEEFAVYDCSDKPKASDKVTQARIHYFTFKDYLKEFDYIWDTFSKEAVESGSHDKYVQSDSKKGTTSVDDEFLVSLDSWRVLLAKDIFKNNSNLNEEQLNFLVQHTIDRIIFLRIAEDRNVETYGSIQSCIKSKNSYRALFKLFQAADEKYNSGLFDFEKDKLSAQIIISDECLSEIVSELYFPKCSYEFSVIPVEILGSAYEQFLGKKIQITDGGKIKIEEKPEVRKAGGVYYTPQYIVDYVVKNTIGKLIEGKTPKQIEKIKILDPSSGSGSFLLGAYGFLLDYHLNYFRRNKKPSTGKKDDPLNPDGSLRTEIKKKILLNNIYGVDLDANAVEVTKLSLLLKCLEGETQASINSQMSLFHERVLPTLDNNIKCGNSLVETDFFELEADNMILKQVRPFSWKRGFPEVFKHGGFDVIISNPPYVYLPDQVTQEYYLETYKYQNYQQDLYLIFLEKYQMLLVKGGMLGVIVSNTWLQSVLLRNIRKYLINNYVWAKILHLPEKVFKAVVDTHVLIFENDKPTKKNKVIIELCRKGVFQKSHELSQFELPRDGEAINVVASTDQKSLFNKIKQSSIELVEVCDVFNGVKPFEKGKGVPPQTEKTMKEKPFVKVDCKRPGKDWAPLLRGSLIRRYTNLWDNNSWILYGKWLAAPRNPEIFSAPEKIMVRQTGDSIIATYVEGGFVGRDNLHIVILKKGEKAITYNYLLGLMNSKLTDFYYTQINPEKGEALAQVKKQHVEKLPIFIARSSDKLKKQAHDKIDSYVGQLLKLNKSENRNQNQVSHIEYEIDKLVYELYGLNEDEVKIIEEAVDGNK